MASIISLRQNSYDKSGLFKVIWAKLRETWTLWWFFKSFSRWCGARSANSFSNLLPVILNNLRMCRHILRDLLTLFLYTERTIVKKDIPFFWLIVYCYFKLTISIPWQHIRKNCVLMSVFLNQCINNLFPSSPVNVQVSGFGEVPISILWT